MGHQRESADELIARARRVYAECSSYADEGIRKKRIDHEGTWRGRSFNTEQRFRTHWKRPDRFFFEYCDVPPKFVFPGVLAEPTPEATWVRYAVWGTPE